MAILSKVPGIEVVVVLNDYDPMDEYESTKLRSDEENRVAIRYLLCTNNTVARMRFRFSKEHQLLELGTDYLGIPTSIPNGKLNHHFAVFVRGEFLRRPMIRPCEQLHPRATPEFYLEIAVPRTVTRRKRRKVFADGTEETTEEMTRRRRIMAMGDIVIFVYQSRTLFHSVGEEDVAIRTSLSISRRRGGAQEKDLPYKKKKFLTCWAEQPLKDLDEDQPVATYRFFWHFPSESSTNNVALLLKTNANIGYVNRTETRCLTRKPHTFETINSSDFAEIRAVDALRTDNDSEDDSEDSENGDEMDVDED